MQIPQSPLLPFQALLAREQYTPGAGQMRGLGIYSMIVQSRKAEITYSCIHFSIEEHIACLDVSMDGNLLPILMEVEETRRDAFNNVKSVSPI